MQPLTQTQTLTLTLTTPELPPPQSVRVERVSISICLTGPENTHRIRLPLHEGQYLFDFRLCSPIIGLLRYSIQESIESIWLEVNGYPLTIITSAPSTETNFEMITQLSVVGDNPLLNNYLYRSVAHLCIRFHEPPKVDYYLEYTVGFVDKMHIELRPRFNQLIHQVSDINGVAAIMYQQGVPTLIGGHLI